VSTSSSSVIFFIRWSTCHCTISPLTSALSYSLYLFVCFAFHPVFDIINPHPSWSSLCCVPSHFPSSICSDLFPLHPVKTCHANDIFCFCILLYFYIGPFHLPLFVEVLPRDTLSVHFIFSNLL